MATWRQENDSNGKSYNVCFQAFANECGACSVAVITRVVANKNIDVAAARTKIFEYEKVGLAKDGLHRSFDSGSAALALWQSYGCLTSSYASALSDLGVKSAYGGNKVKDHAHLLKIIRTRTSGKKPALVTVGWQGGGAHAVVTMGAIPGNNIAVLDPYYGLQEVPIATFPVYQPNASAGATAAIGASGSGNGRFKLEIVTTN